MNECQRENHITDGSTQQNRAQHCGAQLRSNTARQCTLFRISSSSHTNYIRTYISISLLYSSLLCISEECPSEIKRSPVTPLKETNTISYKRRTHAHFFGTHHEMGGGQQSAGRRRCALRHVVPVIRAHHRTFLRGHCQHLIYFRCAVQFSLPTRARACSPALFLNLDSQLP